MILRNQSLSAVSLFGIIRPFAIPFTVYQFYSCAWQFDDHWSAIYKSGFSNNRARGTNITSCHWNKNI